jgi:general stress protein 26
MMSDLKEKLFNKMQEPCVWSLATITSEGKPWVRYVSPHADRNLTIWFASIKGSRKVAQIEANPEVHLTMGITDPTQAESYLQIQGAADFLDDASTKKEHWFDELSSFFSGPDDPNYLVCRVIPYRIELQPMTPDPPEVWEA